MRSLMGWMVGALLVGTVVTGAVPARAGEYDGVDRAGDVRAHDLYGDGTMPSGLEPRRRALDITRYSVRYGSQRVRVAMHLRDLNRRDPTRIVQARLQFPYRGDLERSLVMVSVDPANPAGYPESVPYGCEVDHRFDYQRDLAVLTFPASCVGTPRWVQVNPVTFATDDVSGTSYWYADSRYPIYGARADERFGPRVHRTPPVPPPDRGTAG